MASHSTITWKYLAKGGEWGPMSEGELRHAISRGDVKAETPIMSSEDGIWKSAFQTSFRPEFPTQHRSMLTQASAAPPTTKRSPLFGFGSVIGILFLGYLGYQYVSPMLSRMTSGSSYSASSSSEAAGVRRKPAGEGRAMSTYLGCRSQDDFTRFTRLLVSGDTEAANRFRVAKLDQGTCKTFQKDETVYRENFSFDGTVCLRSRGDVDCYWTIQEVFQN